jgi:hypothetical protein
MWTDWQASAKAHIAKFMDGIPHETTWQERQKILRDRAWEFTGGTSWGKKVWAKHCAVYLAIYGKPPRKGRTPEAKAQPMFADDIIFPFRGGSNG